MSAGGLNNTVYYSLRKEGALQLNILVGIGYASFAKGIRLYLLACFGRSSWVLRAQAAEALNMGSVPGRARARP